MFQPFLRFWVKNYAVEKLDVRVSFQPFLRFWYVDYSDLQIGVGTVSTLLEFLASAQHVAFRRD